MPDKLADEVTKLPEVRYRFVTKVLYVEHNDDNIYMLKRRLELLSGFEVLAADDSERVAASWLWPSTHS
jgi:hypothetical protein